MAVLEDREVAADPVEVCPLPYNTRLSTVKILMELELWDDATQVQQSHFYHLLWMSPACYTLDMK